MTSLYPDPGGLRSDKLRLEHAVHFATAQRVHTSTHIRNDAGRDDLSEDELLYLAVEAFEEKMTATEDTLGWVLVLNDWMAGTKGHSLYELIDRVQMRPGDEERARCILEDLDAITIRDLLRLRDEDLRASSLREESKRAFAEAAPSWLAGLRRLADFRMGEDRRRVVSFNKSKHMALGVIYNLRREGRRVLRFVSGNPPILVSTVSPDPAAIRQVAAETIVIQAVLHSMLVAVLLTHYEAVYAPPPWLLDVGNLHEGWAEDSADDLAPRLVIPT